MRIEDVDVNMKADTLGDVDVKFYDVRKAPFKIYGLYYPETEDVPYIPHIKTLSQTAIKMCIS